MFYLTTHSAHVIYMEGRKEIFYLTTCSTHFIYGYMASDIWLRTILIVRKETRCRHIGWCNKGRGMYYPVCGMMPIKEPLLLIEKSSLCVGSGFLLSLSEWSFTIWATQQGFFYMHHATDRLTHITAFVTPVVDHWLEREIAQWVHSMKDRSDDPSHHERYISLQIGR